MIMDITIGMKIRDGEPLTFNLEVSNHYTSSGNMGWYVQDITYR